MTPRFRAPAPEINAYAAPASLRSDPGYSARALKLAADLARQAVPSHRSAAEIARLDMAAVLGPTRIRPAVWARFAVMLALHERGLRKAAIARKINRDRTTVREALPRARELAAKDHAFAAILEKVRAA